MIALLHDLYGHQAWADTEHWRAIQTHPSAGDDTALRNRLHHLHIVQRSFMWAVSDRAERFVFSTPEDFPQLDQLKTFARGSHEVIDRTLATLTDERLAESIGIPWFRDPPLTIRVSEAMTQCAMHSQWHRGQNATRLRELGAEPPPVDLIVWYAKGRPSPGWD